MPPTLDLREPPRARRKARADVPSIWWSRLATNASAQFRVTMRRHAFRSNELSAGSRPEAEYEMCRCFAGFRQYQISNQPTVWNGEPPTAARAQTLTEHRTADRRMPGSPSSGSRAVPSTGWEILC
jgi:hypothetical protein